MINSCVSCGPLSCASTTTTWTPPVPIISFGKQLGRAAPVFESAARLAPNGGVGRSGSSNPQLRGGADRTGTTHRR